MTEELGIDELCAWIKPASLADEFTEICVDEGTEPNLDTFEAWLRKHGWLTPPLPFPDAFRYNEKPKIFPSTSGIGAVVPGATAGHLEHESDLQRAAGVIP